MDVVANNNGGATGGNRKYPNEHGYEADMGKGLYHPENFRDMSVDTIRCSQQRHDGLYVDNFLVVVMRP